MLIIHYFYYNITKARMKEPRLYGEPPQPPKKAMSSFLLFRAEVFDTVKQQNPGLHITDLTLIISQMWNNSSDETKHRLQMEHEKNRIVTNMEKQEFQNKYGIVERKKRKKRGRRGSSGMNWSDRQAYVPRRRRARRMNINMDW